MTQVDGK